MLRPESHFLKMRSSPALNNLNYKSWRFGALTSQLLCFLSKLMMQVRKLKTRRVRKDTKKPKKKRKRKETNLKKKRARPSIMQLLNKMSDLTTELSI